MVFHRSVRVMPRNITLRGSKIHGKGVFAVRDIPAESEIIEYKGRLITHGQANHWYGTFEGQDDGHTFLLTLNDKYVIDANVGGNWARWINHSCDPNCEIILFEAETGDPRDDSVVVCALRDIKAGEELTYSYGIQAHEPVTPAIRALWACRCESPFCQGTILDMAS